MKILRVIASMNPMSGGPCQGIRNAIPQLEKLGFETEVVCLDDPNQVFLGKDSFKITALGPTKTAWQYSNKLYPWLLQNICKFDAVIVHGLWLYHGFAVRKVLAKLNKEKQNLPKLYVMPHGMLDPYFQKNEARKLKAIRNIIYWNLIESKLINIADAILFTCQAELLLARETFKPYQPKKELNIGYGIQTPPNFMPSMELAFREKCIGLNRNFILFLSRIHEKKGVENLIAAYEAILQLHTNTESIIPQLVIAGPGIDSDLGIKLNTKVQNSSLLKSNVIFPGMLTGDSKWGAFYLCDAFILPSHQENFGIAVAESLACEKPVLISNQVNIYKEIEIENAGFIASDTYEGVLDLLTNWLKLNPEKKQSMRKNAAMAFTKYFTIQAAAARFKSVIN
ncbi:MAG: glycosyltransferase [bacterium]|nr:glycosyltransferase [bacterium]